MGTNIDSAVPAVSIIMPVRNAAQWLNECLLSIVGQSVIDWELIAVDDHSADRSASILQEFAGRDSRIRVLNNQGSGIIDAIKTSFEVSRGTYITRMDADDLMPQDKIKKLFALASQDNSCVVTGLVKYFADEGLSPGYQQYEQWLNERCLSNDHYEWIYRECVIASPNWMTHRKNIDLRALIYPEDYHMTFKWYAQGLPIRSVKAVTHLWREHKGRTSRISEHYNQLAFFRLKLDQFLNLDYSANKPLVIFGKNEKTKIISRFLNERGITHLVIGIEVLIDFDTLEKPQVLVAVYPSHNKRQHIEAFFAQRGLKPAVDWWWL